MNPNDSPSPFKPQPHMQEEILKTVGFQIERKVFILQLRENSRGRCLRITEQGNKIPTSIIVPCTGLNDFNNLLTEMLKEAENQPKQSPPD